MKKKEALLSRNKGIIRRKIASAATRKQKKIRARKTIEFVKLSCSLISTMADNYAFSISPSEIIKFKIVVSFLQLTARFLWERGNWIFRICHYLPSKIAVSPRSSFCINLINKQTHFRPSTWTKRFQDISFRTAPCCSKTCRLLTFMPTAVELCNSGKERRSLINLNRIRKHHFRKPIKADP